MARQALRKVLMILDRKDAGSSNLTLPGLPEKPWDDFLKSSISHWTEKYGITSAQAHHLAHLYGKQAEHLLDLTIQNPEWKKPIHPERPEIAAQVIFAVQKEKAFHLDDVMLRRLEIGYSAQRWGESAKNISRLMAQLLNWDEPTRLKELESYRVQLYPQPLA